MDGLAFVKHSFNNSSVIHTRMCMYFKPIEYGFFFVSIYHITLKISKNENKISQEFWSKPTKLVKEKNIALNCDKASIINV
jgi:hypothetical protein